jgi:hypothetical protein
MYLTEKKLPHSFLLPVTLGHSVQNNEVLNIFFTSLAQQSLCYLELELIFCATATIVRSCCCIYFWGICLITGLESSCVYGIIVL